jgi:tRNA(adenine34) deaminase
MLTGAGSWVAPKLIDFGRNRGYILAMDDAYFMDICLAEAQEAFDEDEVPVGAAVVSETGTIVARTHNLTRQRNSAIAHAEILAIEEASGTVGNFRLTGCTLYVSKEPCVMCAGAIVEARLTRIVFGCFDERRGACGSIVDVSKLPLNHKVKVSGGVRKEESEQILQKFFKLRRGTEVAITGPTRNRLYV